MENEADVAAALVTLLEPDSPAYVAVQHLGDAIYEPGGLAMQWQALRDRLPEQASMNQKGEALESMSPDR